uniref:Uncharacterized protein n=1 Tax=Meloidogyne enterolobii TaxID=390850 RepID=A0A6V7URJ1_MELEN|nr:unnamed protein product [Meloidogyne enterolobii]
MWAIFCLKECCLLFLGNYLNQFFVHLCVAIIKYFYFYCQNIFKVKLMESFERREIIDLEENIF